MCDMALIDASRCTTLLFNVNIFTRRCLNDVQRLKDQLNLDFFLAKSGSLSTNQHVPGRKLLSLSLFGSLSLLGLKSEQPVGQGLVSCHELLIVLLTAQEALIEANDLLFFALELCL